MATGDIKVIKEVAGPVYTEIALAPSDIGAPAVSGGITTIQQITQAAYTALTPKVSTTLYIIVG